MGPQVRFSPLEGVVDPPFVWVLQSFCLIVQLGHSEVPQGQVPHGPNWGRSKFISPSGVEKMLLWEPPCP